MHYSLKKAFYHDVINEFDINLPGIQRRIGFEELPVFLETYKNEQMSINTSEYKSESFPLKGFVKEETALLCTTQEHSIARLQNPKLEDKDLSQSL